ncbi:MAG: long-chain fatty acid--CoA ligase [Bacteroidetes bacterium]|nr:long-chain fatty acid--CoA ligase [Bacteroidota bacterium]
MEVKRTFDILDFCLKERPLDVALAYKVQGNWKTYDTQTYKDISTSMSYGFLKMGLTKEDKVAIISANNRPEWNFVDMGLSMLGITSVPMYPTISEDDFKFIFNDAEVKYVFVSDKDLYEKVQRVLPNAPSIKEIFTFNDVPGAKNWKEIQKLGKENPNPGKLEACKNEVKEDDLLTLIYTSGTTGTPKGVMLTHKNLVSNFICGSHITPFKYHHVALSFLPLCHVFERMLIYLYQYQGLSLYYAESIDTIGENIREIKPHTFTAVPRLIEKVYDKIIAGGNSKTGIQKMIFQWAIKVASEFEFEKSAWYNFKHSIADKLVYSKIRANLGGNILCIVGGSAALQPRLQRFFWAAKIPILEGYGLTETSPVVAVNLMGKGKTKFGTVGEVIENVQVKLAEDGEILVKGPNVMKGYYKRQDLTDLAIIDGWFHTGDIGMFDGKMLKITDRKKEMFKTSGGKYVCPQPIENSFKESPYIEQIMVIGENQKYPAAFIVPAFSELKNWAKEQGISVTANKELIENKAVIKLIQDEVNKYNQHLGKVEQIKRFELIDHEWTIDGGELTPTLKPKRKIIMEKHKDLFIKIFGVN